MSRHFMVVMTGLVVRRNNKYNAMWWNNSDYSAYQDPTNVYVAIINTDVSVLELALDSCSASYVDSTGLETNATFRFASSSDVFLTPKPTAH